MKTLQNNYTTPEQSKRLLELGVPADSADMWWEKDETIRINGEWVHGAAWGKVPNPFNWDRDNNRYYTYSDIKAAVADFIGNETLPCWSVGRLIEILGICAGIDTFGVMCNDAISDTIEVMSKEIDMLDFSKLED